jgi:hypothetical protein
MPDSEQGTGRFIRRTLFNDATQFAWLRVREITEPLHPDGADDQLAQRATAAVAADSQALALVPGDAVVGTRAISLQCESAGVEDACDQSGSIRRTVYAYADPDLGPDGRSFLRLLIAGTGNRSIDPAPYRPLTPATARDLLGKLRDGKAISR